MLINIIIMRLGHFKELYEIQKHTSDLFYHNSGHVPFYPAQ